MGGVNTLLTIGHLDTSSPAQGTRTPLTCDIYITFTIHKIRIKDYYQKIENKKCHVPLFDRAGETDYKRV